MHKRTVYKTILPPIYAISNILLKKIITIVIAMAIAHMPLINVHHFIDKKSSLNCVSNSQLANRLLNRHCMLNEHVIQFQQLHLIHIPIVNQAYIALVLIYCKAITFWD